MDEGSGCVTVAIIGGIILLIALVVQFWANILLFLVILAALGVGGYFGYQKIKELPDRNYVKAKIEALRGSKFQDAYLGKEDLQNLLNEYRYLLRYHPTTEFEFERQKRDMSFIEQKIKALGGNIQQLLLLNNDQLNYNTEIALNTEKTDHLLSEKVKELMRQERLKELDQKIEESTRIHTDKRISIETDNFQAKVNQEEAYAKKIDAEAEILLKEAQLKLAETEKKLHDMTIDKIKMDIEIKERNTNNQKEIAKLKFLRRTLDTIDVNSYSQHLIDFIASKVIDSNSNFNKDPINESVLEEQKRQEEQKTRKMTYDADIRGHDSREAQQKNEFNDIKLDRERNKRASN